VTNKLKNQSYYDNVENLEDLHFNSVNFYQYNKKLEEVKRKIIGKPLVLGGIEIAENDFPVTMGVVR
jgi:hypothetical protein